MGGHAFEQAIAQDGGPRIRTPRMTVQKYEHLKAVYLERLRALLPGHEVETLLEAPEKESYGDLDFIISSDHRLDLLDLAGKIGARAIIPLGNAKVQMCNLAVRKNGEKSSFSLASYKLAYGNKPLPPVTSSDAQDIEQEEYAQLDIEIIPSSTFRWFAFYASYGDLAGLLGKLARNFGFRVTDKGLWLRFQELDDIKDVKWMRVADTEGIMFLSSDPDQVMKFFGLDAQRYWRRFKTIKEYYGWLAECRFLSPEVVKVKRNNHSERAKQTKRMIYSRFLDEYLPAHFGLETETMEHVASVSGHEKDSTEPTNTDPKPDFTYKRTQYLSEALQAFQTESEYDRMHTALVLFIRNQTAEQLIKPFVAAHSGRKDKKLTEVLRAFRRWVVFENGRTFLGETPHEDEEAQLHFWLGSDDASLRDEEAVSAWVKMHWEEIKNLERERAKAGKGK